MKPAAPPETYHATFRASKLAALGLSAALLAGCALGAGDEEAPESNAVPVLDATPVPVPERLEPEPELTVPEEPAPAPLEQSQTECSFRSVEVGRYFNIDSQSEIADQLSALQMLGDESQQIGLSETADILQFIRYSFADPLFAEAAAEVVDAQYAGQEAPSADEFLMTDVTNPPQCDSRHLTRSAAHIHLQHTVVIKDYVTDIAGDRLGENTRRLIEQLQAEFEEVGQ